MRILLITDTPAARACTACLAGALEAEGVEVFDDLELPPDTLSTSDLPMGMDAVGLFTEADLVPAFLRRFRQACRLRGRSPIPVFTGPLLPLVGDGLAADLLPRLGADLLCLHGPRQHEELDDLARTSGCVPPPALLMGPWSLASPGHSASEGQPTERPRRLLFLEQAALPPAPGARLRLLEVLERLCLSSPSWEVVIQPDAEPDQGAPPPADGPMEEQAHESLSTLLQARPATPANLRLGDGSAGAVAKAGVCATISSPLLWQALAHKVPLILLGDYGIRTDMDGPLLFGSGLMGRLTTCDHLDELLDLPAPNPGWLHELGWEIGDGARRLRAWVQEHPCR